MTPELEFINQRIRLLDKFEEGFESADQERIVRYLYDLYPESLVLLASELD